MEEQPSKNVLSENGAQNDKSLAAFEKLVRQHTGWMLALANRILNDKAKAEDAVQNAFANIHKGLDSFENRADIKTWMHRIVVNEALMVLRKSKRLNEQSLDGLLPKFDVNGCRIVAEAVTSETPETELTTQQTLAIVRNEISLLPEPYGLVLILRDIEGIPTVEVAELVGVSEANVRVRLHRARAALKKRLEPLISRGVL
ncbi:sigma-70 family RNA polymerase sigma factor [Ascidiaceihabitans sp.]|uniref:RNA polymerase sigma factor n=1 Tax=Rhodobacterales TaxID=204455 RepID=UPI003296FA11